MSKIYRLMCLLALSSTAIVLPVLAADPVPAADTSLTAVAEPAAAVAAGTDVVAVAAATKVPDDPAVTAAIAAVPQGPLTPAQVIALNRARKQTPPTPQLADAGHLMPLYAAYMTELYCQKSSTQVAMATNQSECGTLTLEKLIPICTTVWKTRLPRPDGIDTAERPSYLKFVAGFQGCLDQARRQLSAVQATSTATAE